MVGIILKICDKSICKPLQSIFRSFIEKGKLPSEWKKVNVVPVYKIGNKQILENYHLLYISPPIGKLPSSVYHPNK